MRARSPLARAFVVTVALAPACDRAPTNVVSKDPTSPKPSAQPSTVTSSAAPIASVAPTPSGSGSIVAVTTTKGPGERLTFQVLGNPRHYDVTFSESNATLKNPIDSASGEPIRADGAKCFVALGGFINGKHVSVPCPPAMDDPAYDDCPLGRVYLRKEKPTCVCLDRFTNPPSPPEDVLCPK